MTPPWFSFAMAFSLNSRGIVFKSKVTKVQPLRCASADPPGRRECGEVFAAGRAACDGKGKHACSSQSRLSAGPAVGGTTLFVCLLFRGPSCGSWTQTLLLFARLLCERRYAYFAQSLKLDAALSLSDRIGSRPISIGQSMPMSGSFQRKARSAGEL